MAFKYTIRADGRLMKRVSVKGKLETIYSDNPKDLERQYIELKYKNNKGIGIEDNSLTLGEWSKRWLDIYKSDKEDSTQKMYREVINIYIIPYLGNIKLKNLKQQDIVGLLNTMTKNGITRRKDITLLTIKQILKKAVENDYIYKNIADGIIIKKYKSPEKTPLDNNIISEIKKLSENDYRAFIILFMIYTGLRKEEVIPLQFKDINLESKYITVNKAVNLVHNTPIIKKTKTGEVRLVPILNIIYDKLRELKLAHNDEDYLFPNNNGSMMSDTTMKRQIKYVLRDLNKELERRKKEENPEYTLSEEDKIYFTYHQLRHTYVCILHKAGVDLKEAQSFTGHKTIQVILDIYTHLDSEDKSIAINKLNSFID